MDGKTAITNLLRNHWEWDYPEFCRRLGFARSAHAEEMFTLFQTAAAALRRFDDRRLAVLTGDAHEFQHAHDRGAAQAAPPG